MIEITRGDDVQLNTAITYADNATPYNLAAVQGITFTVRLDYGGQKIIEKTVGSGIVVTDGPAGLISVFLEPADTQSLPSTVCRLPYDIEIIDQTGRTFTTEIGRLRVNPDVSYADA